MSWDAIRTAAACCLMLALAACASTRGGPIAYDVHGFTAPDAPRPAPLDQNYVVAAGDLLTVSVFQVEALSHDYLVDPAGNINMPLIGSVSAGGATITQLQQQIAQSLSAKYMQRPDVTVAVKESSTRNITVDGSVKTPGVFPVTADISLLQAVALARGTDEGANPHRVAIFRTIQGKRMAAAFDLTEIRRGQAEDPAVYPGDIVVVDGSRTSATLKSVLQSLPVLSLFRPF